MEGIRRRKHLALLHSEPAVGGGGGLLMLSPSAQMGAIHSKLPIVRSVSGEIRRHFSSRHSHVRSVIPEVDLYRQYLLTTVFLTVSISISFFWGVCLFVCFYWPLINSSRNRKCYKSCVQNRNDAKSLSDAEPKLTSNQGSSGLSGPKRHGLRDHRARFGLKPLSFTGS